MEALYVTPQVRLPDDDYARLFPELASRKIPTYSLIGQAEVRLGAFAGQFPEIWRRLARRTALNIHQMLLGIPPSELTVYLPVQEQLLINLDTARAIGYTPDLQTLIAAEFVHRDALMPLEGEWLTLAVSMQ